MEEPFGEAGRYGPVLRFGFFLGRPFELRERGSGDAARLEPLVTVGLTAGAVSPSALLRDIEGTGWIDGWLTPVGLADANELDESAVHSDESDTRDKRTERAKVSERETGFEPANPLVGNQMLYQAELLPRRWDCKSRRELELAPSKLSCRFSAVTIRAANVALFDLFENYLPRAVVRDPRNLVGFQ